MLRIQTIHIILIFVFLSRKIFLKKILTCLTYYFYHLSTKNTLDGVNHLLNNATKLTDLRQLLYLEVSVSKQVELGEKEN